VPPAPPTHRRLPRPLRRGATHPAEAVGRDVSSTIGPQICRCHRRRREQASRGRAVRAHALHRSSRVSERAPGSRGWPSTVRHSSRITRFHARRRPTHPQEGGVVGQRTPTHPPEGENGPTHLSGLLSGRHAKPVGLLWESGGATWTGRGGTAGGAGPLAGAAWACPARGGRGARDPSSARRCRGACIPAREVKTGDATFRWRPIRRGSGPRRAA
jgi:hypothetical protein